jgi:hypothetical protein
VDEFWIGAKMPFIEPDFFATSETLRGGGMSKSESNSNAKPVLEIDAIPIVSFPPVKSSPATNTNSNHPNPICQ